MQVRYTLIILVVLSLTFFVTPSFAGFEWVPPQNKPAKIAEPFVTSPVTQIHGVAAPRASVSAIPLGDAVPQQLMPQNREGNHSNNKLVIDPYPLHSRAALEQVSMTEIYRAMNEEAGRLHPVQLGNKMATNSSPITSRPIPPAQRLVSNQISSFSENMTPMMGNEPAALSGIVRAPIAPVATGKHYAQAIGFGRDLPMVLALSQVIPDGFTHGFAKGTDTSAIVSWEGGKPWDQVLNDMLRPKNLTAVIQGNKVVIQPMAQL